MYALNASTGAKLWNKTLGEAVLSGPAVASGTVYIGYGYLTVGGVCALAAATGNLIWNTTMGTVEAGVIDSPAVVGGVVYVGSLDKKMYALNASTGAQIWSYTTGGGISSSPAVASGTVYIGSGDAKIYALNATNGNSIWNQTATAAVFSSPAVADSVVYIGAEDSHVYAIGGRVPDVSITNIKQLPLPYGATAVYQTGTGWYVSTNVTVHNGGSQSENFQVMGYYGGKPMAGAAQLVTSLAIGASKTVTITWYTSGADPSTYSGGYVPYNITAKITNNSPVQNGTLIIRKPADANGNGHCDVGDLALIGANWYKCYPTASWRPDFTGDGCCKVGDLAILGSNWYKY